MPVKNKVTRHMMSEGNYVISVYIDRSVTTYKDAVKVADILQEMVSMAFGDGFVTTEVEDVPIPETNGFLDKMAETHG